MNDINFTTYDVKAIVNYIKDIIRTKGYNYNITEMDLNTIPYPQYYAVDKFKQKFGPSYIFNINKIYDDFIIFKGGNRSGGDYKFSHVSPIPGVSSEPKVQEISKYKKLKEHAVIAGKKALPVTKDVAEGVFSGLFGTSSPEEAQSTAQLAGILAGQIVKGVAQQKLAAKGSTIEPTIEPTIGPAIGPIIEPVETERVSDIAKVVSKEIVKKIPITSDITLEKIKNACIQCKQYEKKTMNELSKESENIENIVENCKLCNPIKEIICPKGGSYNKNIFMQNNDILNKKKKPEINIEEYLNTIESLE